MDALGVVIGQGTGAAYFSPSDCLSFDCLRAQSRMGGCRGRRSITVEKLASVKVLFLLNTLGSGGTESSLVVSLPIMVECGIRPLVACFESQLATRDSVFEGQISKFSDIVTVAGDTRSARVRCSRKLIRDWSPDIVHSSLMEANLVSRFACVGLKSILVNSLVSMSYTPARFELPKTNVMKHRCLQLADLLTGWLFVDHFHAVNQAVKDEAVRSLLIPEERITVVQRGRQIKSFSSQGQGRVKLRKELGASEDDFLLCSVGRQSHVKGQLDLLEAFRMALEVCPDLRLVVAGRKGDCSDELGSFIEAHSLDGRVALLGHRDDVPELLCASDMFVFPSRLEGIGGAAIEAMAAGLPVIASDIPGLRETLGSQGELNFVPIKSPRRLFESIVWLKRRPELRREQGLKNRKRFEETFQVRPNAEKMVEFYGQVLGRGRRRWYERG